MGIAETFKALSDPQRRDLLTFLRDGRLNAGELSEKLNITPAALSYHLKLLKKADLRIWLMTWKTSLSLTNGSQIISAKVL